MGWWRTWSGHLIGDAPANLIDETGVQWTTPSEMPAGLRRKIADCYQEDFGRGPTEQELQELLDFCR